tara:strand:+ start:539 stop:766 length:228 start_codon:yes stop_codon:yes gene_type:complete
MNKRTGSRSRYWFTSPAERKFLEKDKDITGEEYADMILSDMSELDLRGPHLLNGAETEFVLEWSEGKNVSIVCMI